MRMSNNSEDKSLLKPFNKKLCKSFIIVFALLAFIGFVYGAVIHFRNCVDVISWTIPAGSASEMVDFSLKSYMKKTGFANHFNGMPLSAQKYLVVNSIGFFADSILAVIFAVIAGIRVNIYRRERKTALQCKA